MSNNDFLIPLAMRERFEASIECLRNVEDEHLPADVKKDLVHWSTVSFRFVFVEVPIVGESLAWWPEGCTVRMIAGYDALIRMRELLEGEYSGLTDLQLRPEACPGLGSVAKQAIDNLVGSIADLIRYFIETAGFPNLRESGEEMKVGYIETEVPVQ